VPASEAVGQPVAKLFTPEDVAAGIPEREMRTAAAHGTAEDDRWLARPDGSRFWASGVMNALRDTDGQLLGFGKILRDRTDIREQFEPLRNQVEAVPPRADLDGLFKVIDRQAENLRRLVDDLLDASRVRTGKIDLEKTTISLQDVVQHAFESTRPFVKERRQTLETLLPPTPMLVEGDFARLEQVFVNLINNSAKYTPEEGHIWIKGTTVGDEAVVHVEDTGIGIPHEMLPRIFDLTQGAISITM
jgi:signal transduction histidine kinase